MSVCVHAFAYIRVFICVCSCVCKRAMGLCLFCSVGAVWLGGTTRHINVGQQDGECSCCCQAKTYFCSPEQQTICRIRTVQGKPTWDTFHSFSLPQSTSLYILTSQACCCCCASCTRLLKITGWHAHSLLLSCVSLAWSHVEVVFKKLLKNNFLSWVHISSRAGSFSACGIYLQAWLNYQDMTKLLTQHKTPILLLSPSLLLMLSLNLSLSLEKPQ